jgi:hypothetical protein
MDTPATVDLKISVVREWADRYGSTPEWSALFFVMGLELMSRLQEVERGTEKTTVDRRDQRHV